MLPRSEQQILDQKEVRRKASRYILEKLGDRLWAGKPVYDTSRGQWTMPIHVRSLPAAVDLGPITLDAYGHIVHAPSRRTLQRAIQRQQSETAAPLSLLPFALAPTRAPGAEAREPLPLPDLPDDPTALGHEVLSEPDLCIAYQYLKLALADPQIRPTVLAALEAFARAARPPQ